MTTSRLFDSLDAAFSSSDQPQTSTRQPRDFGRESQPSALLDNLNREQLAAVTLPAEHALILAGAGSGKTRVLTTRIAWLLQSGMVSPGAILAVTFTNKAAKEMLTRLGAMLPINVRGMWVGTFHGLCNRFLRAHYQTAGLPQGFQILDTQDQLSAIKRLLKRYNIDDERFPPKQVQWFIAAAKEDGLRPKDMESRDMDMQRKIDIYQLYEEQCQTEGVVDFGELMLRSYEVLRDHAAIREHYQHRFKHILIDEFQDTNKLQYAWLKMFAGSAQGGLSAAQGAASAHNALFAVGDDDQSIYAFRGARVGNMADFVREYNVQHQIKLEQNYRSSSNILESANALIAHNKRRLGKDLRTDAGSGEPVRVYEATSDYAEAQWIVEEISSLLRDGLERREIAILYRSNAQSRVIESTLMNAGIAYRVYGGLRFFERAEVKHALAYLRLIENPLDDTSFLRVVNFPPRGIGARSIEQLQDAAQGSHLALSQAIHRVTGKAGANLSAFVALIDVMRERTAGATLKEMIQLVIEHTGLIEHYRSEREGQDRIENLNELVNAAQAFVALEGFGSDAEGLGTGRAFTNPDTGETLSPLSAFLSHASLEAGDNQAQAGQDAVQLMTVHAAKGLEFDVVFIAGLEEGLFPHENAMSDHDGLEEERRLMYVAITRARQRLYLAFSQTRMLHGQTRYHIKSRFLDELPENCLKWVSPPNQGFASGLGGYAGGSGGWWNKPKAQTIRGRDVIPQKAPSALPAQRKLEGQLGFSVGQTLFHNKFGEGTVLALEGKGADARIHIHFPRHGRKWLALAIAKLTPVQP